MRESKGESERLRFLGESEGKRLIPFSARKRYKKCKISPVSGTNARFCIFGACFILIKSPRKSHCKGLDLYTIHLDIRLIIFAPSIYTIISPLPISCRDPVRLSGVVQYRSGAPGVLRACAPYMVGLFDCRAAIEAAGKFFGFFDFWT